MERPGVSRRFKRLPPSPRVDWLYKNQKKNYYDLFVAENVLSLYELFMNRLVSNENRKRFFFFYKSINI